MVASSSDQTPFVAVFSAKENSQRKVTVVVKHKEGYFADQTCHLFSAQLSARLSLSPRAHLHAVGMLPFMSLT